MRGTIEDFRRLIALARYGFSEHCFIGLSESFIFVVGYFRTRVFISLFGNQSFLFITVLILVSTFNKDL
jgi:hypothetical protein